MGRPVDTVLARPLTDRGEQAIVDALERAREHGHIDDEVARWRAEILAREQPSDPFLARLAQILEQSSDPVRLGLWQDIHAALPHSGQAIAHRADALIDAHDEAAALALLLDAVEGEPGHLELFDQLPNLAERSGGRDEFRYRVVVMRALIEDARSRGDQEGDSDRVDESESSDDESVDIREQYSELLEAYRDDGAALAILRKLGARIRELEDEGVLPSVLVRRGDWREHR